MTKIGQKTKFRVTFLILCLIITSVLFVSKGFSYVSQIMDSKKEIALLQEKYDNTLNEEENLKDKLNKLEDPEYMAKYAREKYLYSKDNEIVIKIEE